MRTALYKPCTVFIALIAGISIAEAASTGLRGIRRQFAGKDYVAAEAALRNEMPGMKGGTFQQAQLLLAAVQTEVPEAKRILFSIVRSAERREELSARLELAKIAFALGDYGNVVELLSPVPDHGRGSERLEAIYFRGMANKLRGDIETARNDMNLIDRGEFLFWSSIALAEIDMQSGRFHSAVERLETMAGSRSNPIAGFWLGECYEVLGERDKALAAYRTLAVMFPQSPEAPKAREKISMIESASAQGKAARRAGGGEQRKTPVADTDQTRRDSPQYSLQFGAFSDRENARALVVRLENDVEGLHIETVQAGGAVWHRVRSGRFPSRAEAEEAASRITKQTGYTSKVLSVE